MNHVWSSYLLVSQAVGLPQAVNPQATKHGLARCVLTAKTTCAVVPVHR